MKYKLVCFDLDGTILDIEDYIWNNLHDAFGVPSDYRSNQRELFRNKKISYKEWFDADVREWVKRGITKDDIVGVVQNVKLVKGSLETLSELKKRNYKLALISGSLNIVVDILLPNHPFDDVMTNMLYFDTHNKIVGWEHTPFDEEHKLTGMKLIAEREKRSLKECVFVGDNENDVTIAKAAGLSIAFMPKSKELEEVSDVIIKKKDLREILKYL